MLILKQVLGYLGIAALLCSFAGSVYAAYTRMPSDNPWMKFFKWCFRGGLAILIIDNLIIIGHLLLTVWF